MRSPRTVAHRDGGSSKGAIMPKILNKTLWQRFREKFEINHKTDCWDWMAAKSSTGYGLFSVNAKLIRAHRFSYESQRGPIPEGLTLDHLCRNRGCVNPNHLEAVTSAENILRGVGFSALNAKKTHCPKGHPLSGENLLNSPSIKGRQCRICANYYAKLKRLNNKPYWDRYNEKRRNMRLLNRITKGLIQ